jgi:MoaA/NifB/PqqE/SkfB family radical SAM enzyme
MMIKKEKKKELIPEFLAWLKREFPLELTLNQKRLNRLAQDPQGQRRFLARMVKIMKMISHPAARAGFFRAYLRIYVRKINKDGRHGSVVMEITKRCNQQCRHCYSWAQRKKKMSDQTINRIIRLVHNNYKHIFITGGEPTLDKRIFKIAAKNPDIMFFMFTNGSVIGQNFARKLASIGNLIPVLSFDGDSASRHDYFKGKGSWQKLMRAIKILNSLRLPWGYLSMITNLNARQVLSKKFVKAMKKRGAILARYLEYIPVGLSAKSELVPSGVTYNLMEKRKQEIIKNYEIYMQETAQSKCLGLIFFDVDGNIKCCPFFHYAKHNIAQGKIEKSIKDSIRDWCKAEYRGECPVYSDQEGLKAYLLKRDWKPTVSFNRHNAIDPQLAKTMSDNYRAFLKIKTKKGRL